MTVSYTGDVANGSSFGCFWKILYRWRGSVYKLIWRELIAYLCLYYFINFFYRFGLDDQQKMTFVKVKVYCRKNIESIPMSFVLGFYVTLIVKRWWDQYWILPMPDSLALYISASLQGQDERGRLLRRTIMRYTMLAYIICLQRISFRVKKRFPTMQHLVDTGLMTESEMKIYEKMDQKAKVLKFWMPVVWASNLVNRARLEGRIQSDHMVQTVITELSDFRRKLGRVMVYDNVSVPLVYTQVVTLAVYTYFLAALIGRQWVNPREDEVIAIVYPGYNLDLYFPIFLSLQFIFYIGWLKVAETLINPFGEDDDDFELNWLIDRHIKVSYMVVDEMHEEHPELLKDQYWEQVVPQDLPYNVASERYRKNEPQGSTASLKVNPNESVYADLTSVKRHSTIPDDVYAEYESVAESPLADGRKASWLQRQLSRVESFRSTSSSSSLFMRNRTNSAVNGGLGLGYHGHHRPSLYERLMNRRSSKDARHSNRGIHRTTANSLNVPEKGFIPNSRPRVPTPDATKESQLSSQLHLNVTAVSPLPINKVANKIQYTNNDGTITTSAANPGYGSPMALNSSLYAKGKQAPGNTTSQLKNSYPTQQPPLPAAPALPASNPIVPPPKASNPPTPPPPYDTNAGSPANAMMLSTIAENDCSPYSTSSTSHAPNNSNVYPTTTSIFGRKPSPPPLDELPPVPVVMVSSPHSSKNSSLSHKSERDFIVRNHPGGGHSGGGLDNMTFDGDITASQMQSNDMTGRINEGYETDEGDDGRRYMTIAEVNESRVEFEKTLTVLPLQQTFTTPHDSERNSSDFLSSQTGPVTTEVAPTPVRHGIASILRQDAVCLADMDSEVMIPTSITQTELPPLPIDSTSPVAPPNLHNVLMQPSKSTNVEIDNDDDGYHERGSYSEDDDASNHSDKGGGSGTKVTKQFDPMVHSESLSNINSHLVGVQSSLVGNSSSSALELEGEAPRSHSADTLKSNASDSDSHGSTFSVDQTLPIPSRQKAIRRRQSQPDTSVPKSESASSTSALSGNEKTSPNTEISKDCEVFV